MKLEDFKTESPIEERLIAALLPQIGPHVELDSQRWVPGLRHRVDFWAIAAGRVVVIECDGRDFHRFHEDRQRDISILGGGDITDVIRFRGGDIVFDVGGCIDKLRLFFPFLFATDAQPLSLDDLLFASEVLRGGHVKPIIRTRFIHGSKPTARHDTAQLVGVLGDVLELRSPEWGWRYEGPREQSIGDILGDVFRDEKGAQQ